MATLHRKHFGNQPGQVRVGMPSAAPATLNARRVLDSEVEHLDQVIGSAGLEGRPVSGPTERDSLRLAQQLLELYKPKVAVEHPEAQYAMAREFIPGEPLASSAYLRRGRWSGGQPPREGQKFRFLVRRNRGYGPPPGDGIP